MATIAVNPHLSTRQLSGTNKSSISKILRNNRIHPYHISLHQEVTENNFIQRVNFCNFKNQLRMMHSYKKYFFDEATFNNIGAVNRHNMHYWSPVNPRWMQTV